MTNQFDDRRLLIMDHLAHMMSATVEYHYREADKQEQHRLFYKLAKTYLYASNLIKSQETLKSFNTSMMVSWGVDPAALQSKSFSLLEMQVYFVEQIVHCLELMIADAATIDSSTNNASTAYKSIVVSDNDIKQCKKLFAYLQPSIASQKSKIDPDSPERAERQHITFHCTILLSQHLKQFFKSK